MYKLIDDQAQPPLKQCVLLCANNRRETRASARGDCTVKLRKTAFGQSAFSVKAVEKWNLMPTQIRDSATLSVFKSKLKSWLKQKQSCDH